MITSILERPLTKQEILDNIDEQGLLSGLIPMNLYELTVHPTYDDYLDRITEKLIGDEGFLGNMSIIPQAVDNGRIILLVTGEWESMDD